MQDCNVIAKGSYSEFRFNEFVSVRQYLLIREKGKKFLIMKLSNDASETVTGLKLEVEQLDVRGNCLEKNKVEWTDIVGKAGEKFIPPHKIPLRETCMEVKIRLVGATYGDYTYAVKSNELVVTYEKAEKKARKDYSYKTEGESSVLRERKFKIPSAVVTMTLVVLLCAMVATIAQLILFRKTERVFTWKNVKYEFMTDEKVEGAPIRVIGSAGFNGNIVIPEDVEGYPVREIAKDAFRDNTQVRSLKILADVAIGDYAFSGCSNLTSIELLTVREVGNYAFFACGSLEKVTATQLENLGRQAFASCTNLKTVNFSNEEKTLSIGEMAFSNCQALETVSINQTTQYPQNVAIFHGVERISQLTLNNYNSQALETKTDKTLKELFGGATQRNLRTLVINDIDEIPNDFCSDATMMESVALSGLKKGEIGGSAFKGCQNLTAFTADFEENDEAVDKFTSVGKDAFRGTKITTFDGSGLKYIGEYAFAENQALQEIVLEGNEVLTEIDDYAFYWCSNLQTVYIPQFVSAIGKSAFENCSALTAMTFAEGARVKTIGDKAMRGCSALLQITMPDTVTSIGEMAYADCYAVTSINISATLQSIGDRAFQSCEKIKKVIVPSTAKYIGASAFNECKSLEELTVPYVGCSATEKPYLTAIFGGSRYEDFYYVPASLRTVEITGSRNIETGAFYGLNMLKSVKLSGFVEEIGQEAFAYCSNLREIHLSKSLKKVNTTAFINCYTLFEVWNKSDLSITRGSLANGGVARYALAVYGTGDEPLESKDVNGFRFLHAQEGWYVTDYLGEDKNWTLPDSFTDKDGKTVDGYVMTFHLFENRQDVESLTLSNTLTEMGEYAFASCQSLTTVNYPSGTALDTIERNAFSDCASLQTVNISQTAGIVSIGENAFGGCRSLTTIAFPNALTEIKSNAFAYCSSLAELTLPNQLQTVGEYAFQSCEKLTEATVPQSVTRLGYGVFMNTQSLTKISLPFIGETLNENRYAAYLFGQNREMGVSTVQEISVFTATDIPEYAFYNFSNLERVNFGKDVQQIGDFAFAQCYDLTEVNISGQVKTIGAYAFAYTGLESTSVLSSVEEIGNFAFIDVPFTTVILPATLKRMGVGVFQDSELTSVNLQNTQLTILPSSTFYNCTQLSNCTMWNSSIRIISNNAFKGTALTQVRLPRNLTCIESAAFQETSLISVNFEGTNKMVIGDYAFENCADLTMVEMATNAVSEIGSYAFYDCQNLNALTMNEGIETIEESAFAYTALENVVFPSSLNSIGYNAFYNCQSLTSVTLREGLRYINGGAFDGCNQLYEVYNLSSLNVIRGYWDNGQVAANAVIVHRSITAAPLATETVGDLVFKYAATENEACVFACANVPETLNFQAVTLGGKRYSNYWIYKSVFSNNAQLQEVNTGVVTEIGEAAFWNNSALKKVTIGAAISAGKVASNAFDGCSRLWEVHDQNAYYDLTVGGYDCGYVAYYALVINENITYKTESDCQFMKFGGTWYLYDCALSGNVKLPSTEEPYVLFKPRGFNSPLDGVAYGCYVVIPQSVIKIESGVFGYYTVKVYYEGTQTQWENLPKNVSVSSLQVYYLNACVHNSAQGTAYWRYENDQPSTSESALSISTTPSTCQQEGKEIGYCETCKQNITQTALARVSHSYEASGACTWCGQVRLKDGDLGALVEVANNSHFGFMIDKNGDVYSDWRDDYGYINESISLTAKENVTIQFTLRLVSQNATAKVLVNGITRENIRGNQTKEVTIELEAGEELVIRINNVSNFQKESRVYMEDITIVAQGSEE